MDLQLILLLLAVITGIISGWRLSTINTLRMVGIADPEGKWATVFWIILCGGLTCWAAGLIMTSFIS